MITLDPRPEPDAPAMTEAEWHLFLTGCAAWLSAQKRGVTA